MHKKDFLEKLLTVLSHIKVSKWPLFMAYRPRSFAIKGSDTREVLKLVKPGDILVRSFNQYLNGYFIPGTFKHVGFYLSEVTEQHLKQFAHVEHFGEFNTGRQMVIYAIGNQVFLEDVIDFCRCDGLAVMRFPRHLKSLQRRQMPEILQSYFQNPSAAIEDDADTQEPAEKTSFLKKLTSRKGSKSAKTEEEAEEESKSSHEPVAKTHAKLDATTTAIVKAEKDIAQHIAQGKPIEFEKIFKILYRIAIRELTTPHQTHLGISPFDGTTSTELVYFITKSLCWNYGIEPENHRVFFKSRDVILPDGFVDGDLEEVWKSVLL
ncbi:MAG: hypothetical protein DRR16_06770 [Candidatus Parabeggiatoa sp. nov. 3]|nr:MAG: hypothetical protein DRR00_32745 [Gammaproteobacteria bacterium]RKZ56420.1 MAG: hypothetical protein DRQ99_28540 [Gammaproteobacteria bacterium]RKZ87650.1 MAG: hypothetical protein DRR16_06770 [Gammaproteobacteria bacterium]HEW98517.1 hypothetical protein [Beggiatoa sp.]